MQRLALVAAAASLAATLAACGGGEGPAPSPAPEEVALTSEGTPLTVSEGDASVQMGAASGCEGFEVEMGAGSIAACAAQVDEPRPFAVVLHLIDPDEPGSAQLIVYALKRSGEADIATAAVGTEEINVGPPGETRDYYEIRISAATISATPAIVVEYDPPRAHAPDTEYDIVTWEQGREEPGVAVHIGETYRGPSLEVRDDGLVITQPERPGADGGRRKIRTIRRSGDGVWHEAVSFEDAG